MVLAAKFKQRRRRVVTYPLGLVFDLETRFFYLLGFIKTLSQHGYTIPPQDADNTQSNLKSIERARRSGLEDWLDGTKYMCLSAACATRSVSRATLTML